MKAWRLLVALSFLLLSGCLVTFKDSIPAREAAPTQLLGNWTSKNAWGEPLELEISRTSSNEYKALSYRKGDRKRRDTYAFTVSRHGSRWYLSAGLPEKYGGHFVMAGFELRKPASWWSTTWTWIASTNGLSKKCSVAKKCQSGKTTDC